jgi:hypothetical protein
MKGLFKYLALIALSLVVAGCGGTGTATKSGKPIDPSGNWSMKFTDGSGHTLLLSALFSQTGSVVSALNILAAGNPAPFSCVPFSATFANGEVLNVNQFSGDINTSFGNIHFTSTLNDAGTHADGTYTLTGSCWGVAASGTFSADEIPSVSGTWSGTVNCTSNCPAGSASGTISATLTQDDATGNVSGTYAISGLPNISSGSIATKSSDVLSGASWQDSMTDQNTNTYVIAGGPFNGSVGLGLDKSFHGSIFEQSDAHSSSLATYTVSMTH